MLAMAIPDVIICRGLLVHKMLIMYSPHGTNVYGARGGELEVIGSVWGCKMYMGNLLFTCLDTFAAGCIV